MSLHKTHNYIMITVWIDSGLLIIIACIILYWAYLSESFPIILLLMLSSQVFIPLRFMKNHFFLLSDCWMNEWIGCLLSTWYLTNLVKNHLRFFSRSHHSPHFFVNFIIIRRLSRKRDVNWFRFFHLSFFLRLVMPTQP